MIYNHMSFCLSVCDATGNCSEPLCFDDGGAESYPSGEDLSESCYSDIGTTIAGMAGVANCSSEDLKALFKERGPSMATMQKRYGDGTHPYSPTQSQYDNLLDLNEKKILIRGTATKGMVLYGEFVPNGSVLISMHGSGNRNQFRTVYSYMLVAEERCELGASNVPQSN